MHDQPQIAKALEQRQRRAAAQRLSALLDAGKEPVDSTVIVRADAASKTGEVQEIIKVCQEKGFEKFALRAKYDEPK